MNFIYTNNRNELTEKVKDLGKNNFNVRKISFLYRMLELPINFSDLSLEHHLLNLPDPQEALTAEALHIMDKPIYIYYQTINLLNKNPYCLVECFGSIF